MSQDQHFIPQTYLKGFLNAEKKLYRLRKDVPKLPHKMGQVSTAGIGYHPDFNVIKDPRQLERFGLVDVNAIETHFSKNQEQNYSTIINRLLKAEEVLSLSDAREVIMTILLFKQRNIKLREAFKDKKLLAYAFDERIKGLINNRAEVEALLEKFGSSSFEEFITKAEKLRDSVVNSDDTPSVVQTQALLETLNGESDTVNTVAACLLRSTWVLIESPESIPFITSDNPGVTIDTAHQPHNLNFTEDSQFYFPITPQYALLIGLVDPNHDERTEQKKLIRALADSYLVKKLNQWTMNVSHQYILSDDEHALRQTWIESH